MLDWKPAYTLDSALASTVTWYREYLAGAVGDE
jgi:dTDP-D-glucose 4,6-dehydratase